MATYNSTAYSGNYPISSAGIGNGLKVARFDVTCSAAPTTSDTINFGYMPANSRLHLAILEASDMDTNASPTITLNVGDSGSANRIFAASTVAQAGTLSTAIATGGADYLFTSKTLLTGVPAANAATGAAGTLQLTVFYSVDAG